MIRYATIGTSNIADNFAAACALTGKFELAAVYSRSRETGKAFAEKHGCGTVYCDLVKMACDKDIDAVYIASPNVFHAPQSRLFLQNGKHVICEKPIATSAGEYSGLYALAGRMGLVYMEAIMPRYSSARRTIKNAIGKLGRIAQIRLDYCQRSSRYDRFLAGEHVNIFDMSLAAGTLMDLGVYCVYAAVDLFGMPRSIQAAASFLSNGADGSGCAIFDYNDCQAVLTYSKTGQSVLGSEIIGDAGVLKIKSVSQYAGVSLLKDGTETELIGIPNLPALMSGEAQRFADYILHGEKFSADYREASALARNVHTCMDRIKACANIKYNLERG